MQEQEQAYDVTLWIKDFTPGGPGVRRERVPVAAPNAERAGKLAVALWDQMFEAEVEDVAAEGEVSSARALARTKARAPESERVDVPVRWAAGDRGTYWAPGGILVPVQVVARVARTRLGVARVDAVVRPTVITHRYEKDRLYCAEILQGISRELFTRNQVRRGAATIHAHHLDGLPVLSRADRAQLDT